MARVCKHKDPFRVCVILILEAGHHYSVVVDVGLPELAVDGIRSGFLVLMGIGFIYRLHAPVCSGTKYCLISVQVFPSAHLWKWELRHWILCVLLIVTKALAACGEGQVVLLCPWF